MKTCTRLKSIVRALAITAFALNATVVSGSDGSILIQSTTSTANSGLYDYLLPHFESKTGIKVHVVAVGTGQAIRNARNCDADVLLVHARSAEEQFVSEGFGIERHNLMYNDFVIVGDAEDAADIEGLTDITDALQKIATSESVFVSRGDNSGTHKKEVNLWEAATVDPQIHSGKWYRESGSGMGATLNIAIGMGAYALTDRATWINFKNRAGHVILVQGDERLFNQYGITLVNGEKCPHSNTEQGALFIDWITGTEGQSLIADYKLGGQQLFYPNH